MSQTNGHAATDPRQQLRELRTRRAILRAQAEVQALEGYVGLGGYSAPYGQPIDPIDAVRDPITGMLWRPLGDRSDRREAPTALGIATARDTARLLLESNGVAIGLMEHLTSFVVGEGMTYKVAKDKGTNTSPEVIAAVQDVVDEFLEVNLWPELEQELLVRSRRDGEYFLREFPVNGTLHVRTIEPEHVRPPDGPEADCYPLGVRVAERDEQTPEEYWVRCDDSERGEPLSASTVHHCKVNVDRAILRGVSDFYPVADDLEGVRKLLRNMREGGAVQAAIAWIEQFEGASASALSANVQAKRDINRPYPNDPITGRPVNMQRMEPGTVVKTGSNRKYVPAPLAGNVTPHVAIVQACLRSALSRWGMPEYFSGDASNANYASTLVAGSPFVRIVKRLQAFYRRRFLRVVWRAVQVACAAGRLPWSFAEVNRLVDIQAEAPTPEIANQGEQNQVWSAQHQAGVLSTQTWRMKAGLDNETEQQNLKAEPAQQPGGGMPGAGGQPDLPGLFGESLDPLEVRLRHLRDRYGPGLSGDIAAAASRLLEGKVDLLEAGFTGVVTAKNGSKFHYVNGKRVSKASYEKAAGEAKGEPPQVGAAAKKSPTKKQATKEQAALAVAAAVKDPSKLSEADIASLGGHLAALTVPQIASLQKQLGVKGGTVKADKIKTVQAALTTALKSATPASVPDTSVPKVTKAAPAKPAATDVKGTGPGGKVTQKNKAAIEQLVLSQIGSHGDALNSTTPDAINKITKAIAGATDGTVGFWEVKYALQNLATQHADKLLPPQFSKGGAKNKPNPTLPEESRPSLSDKEAVALQRYTGSAFGDLNQSLRNNGTPPDQYAELHKDLQAAFQKVKPFPKPVSVIRGMTLGAQTLQKFIGAVKEAQATGGTLSHPGYVSTSTTAMPKFKGNVELRIQATRGLDLKPYTHYPHENEVLLDHGAQFRVAGVQKVGSRYRINLEQV